mmetsp:Transcript_115115/g.200352  ORF Transcript_115115/g.200352 Transcript_115115/m.200352 type:complete len:348 (-) Transcript_115115:345-1388(-)
MSFANIDSAFLKDEVGPLLAKGMAETAIACPSDPVEYLALWLLHQLQLKELAAKEMAQLEEGEKEKEEWAKVRQKKQGSAASVIQREWKHFVKAEDECKYREKRLTEMVQDKERELEEMDDFREENLVVDELPDMTEIERDKATEKARALMLFKKAQAMLATLDKSYVGAIKQLKKPSKNVVAVMKCCFYCCGSTPRQVREWMQIRMALKPALFLEKILAFEPINPGNKRKRLCTRIRRVLRSVTDEELRGESVAVFLLYQWALAMVELREKHDDEVKVKKEAGKEVEDDEEEEEDPENVDPLDKDPDEEAAKLIEEEEKRKQAEEEAKWKAEQGDDEDGDKDEDEG